MSDLIPFESGAVPAHIAKRFGNTSNNDLMGGVGQGGFPVISYKGKVWHVSQGGNRTLVADDDGDPRPNIEVVILKANPNLSKIYYDSGYEEGSSEKPNCYSFDGIAPAADAAEPQSKKCAICPRNQWGSRITEHGAKGKECADNRRLAVAPVGDLANPMLLRVPAATLKDLVEYAKTIERRGANYNAVVTKIGFDHNVAHPKFTFKPLRWLTDDEANTVLEVLEGDLIGRITGTDTEASIDDELGGAPPAALATNAPAPKAKAKAVVTKAEVEEVVQPKAKAKPAPVEVVEDDEVPEPVKAKASEKVATVIDEANASLDDILALLDD